MGDNELETEHPPSTTKCEGPDGVCRRALRSYLKAPSTTATYRTRSLFADRLAFSRAGVDRVRRVDADTAALTRQLRVGVRRGPVTRTRHNNRVVRAGRLLELHRGQVGRVLRGIREERFFSRDEVAEVRLHRGDVRLRLGVRELRNRDRGENTDDDDDNQQLDERETLAKLWHVRLALGIEELITTGAVGRANCIGNRRT